MHMADRKTSLEETTAMSMQILPFWSLQWHTNVANILILLVYRSPNPVNHPCGLTRSPCGLGMV
jgi:hypothetical protein